MRQGTKGERIMEVAVLAFIGLVVVMLALTCAPAAVLPTPVIYSVSVTDSGKLTVKVNRYRAAPGPLLPPGAHHILVTVYDVDDSQYCCPKREIEGAPGHAGVVALMDPCDLDDPLPVGPLWIGVSFVAQLPQVTPTGKHYTSNQYGPSSALYKVNWTAAWTCIPSGY